jgi:hypothetical protein
MRVCMYVCVCMYVYMNYICMYVCIYNVTILASSRILSLTVANGASDVITEDSLSPQVTTVTKATKSTR